MACSVPLPPDSPTDSAAAHAARVWLLKQAKKFAFKCHRRQENGKDVVYPVNTIGAPPAAYQPAPPPASPRPHRSPTMIPPNHTRHPACSCSPAVFHPVYGTFATGGCDGVVSVWDGEAKKRLYQFAKYPTSVAALAFNAAGTLMAVASSYTFEEGDKQARLRRQLRSAAAFISRRALAGQALGRTLFLRARARYLPCAAAPWR